MTCFRFYVITHTRVPVDQDNAHYNVNTELCKRMYNAAEWPRDNWERLWARLGSQQRNVRLAVKSQSFTFCQIACLIREFLICHLVCRIIQSWGETVMICTWHCFPNNMETNFFTNLDSDGTRAYAELHAPSHLRCSCTPAIILCLFVYLLTLQSPCHSLKNPCTLFLRTTALCHCALMLE